MRTGFRTTIATLVSCAALAACAATQPSMEIRSDRNPAANFAVYATYAWATAPLQAPQWPAHDAAVVNPTLREKRLPQAIAQIFASFPPRTAR